MANFKNHIYKFIGLLLIIIGSILISIIFFKNSSQTPLILHYINNFGDYLGTRSNLLILLIVSWILFFVNLFFAKIIKKISLNLFNFINFGIIIIYFLFFILTLQIFLQNF